MDYVYLDYDQQNKLVEKAVFGDENATIELINFLKPFAAKIVSRFVSPEMSFEDLMQEAICGILLAIPRYRPEKGVKFSTYCSFWMIKQVRKSIRPYNNLNGLGKYFNYINQYMILHGCEPSEDTLKSELMISGDTLKKFKAVSFYFSFENKDDSALPSDDEDFQDYIVLKLIIEEALGILSEEKQQIMIRYWGLFSIRKHSYKEIGNVLGYSREWVRLTELDAREEIKEYLLDIGFDGIDYI